MPYNGKISFEGDPEEAAASLREAVHFATTVELRRNELGVSHFYGARNLINGGYVYAVSIGDYRAVHLVVPQVGGEPEPLLLELEQDEFLRVPDILSGIVKDTVVTVGEIQFGGAACSVDMITSLVQTQESSERFSTDEARALLSVPEYPPLMPVRNDGTRHSQHASAGAQRYSGAMRKLVQLGLGLGRFANPRYELKWMDRHDESMLGEYLTDTKTGEVELTWSGFPEYRLLYDKAIKYNQLKYDYRHARTHGVSFAGDTPCIVEIGTRGVIAIPLQLDPVSLTTEGRERYLAMYPELEELFDLFGGMPTFNSIQNADESIYFDGLENAIRAGEAVRLMDNCDAFYDDKQAMYSACGWAFNERGSEAHNTCWSVDGRYKVGHHYCVTISLTTNELPEYTAAHEELRLGLGYDAPLPLVRKISRLTPDEFDAVYPLIFSTKPKLDRWKDFDAYQVEHPVISGSASLREQKKGKLHNNANPWPLDLGLFGINSGTYHPQIKFPEEMMGGVVSFDFRPIVREGDPLTAPNVECDTPIHVFYRGNSLEVANYYVTSRPQPEPENDTDKQDCQIQGTWTTVSGTTDTSTAGYFYLTSKDLRKEIHQGRTTRTETWDIIGEADSGGYINLFSACAKVSRYTITKQRHWESHKTETEQYQNSLAVPMNERNMILACCVTSKTGKVDGEGGGELEAHHGGVIHWYTLKTPLNWMVDCDTPNGLGDPICRAQFQREEEVETCRRLVPEAVDFSNCYVCDGEYSSTFNKTYGCEWVSNGHWPGFNLSPSPWQKITPPMLRFDGVVHGWFPDGLDAHENILKREAEKVQSNIDTENVHYGDLKLSSWWFVHSPDLIGAVAVIKAASNCLGEAAVRYEADFAASKEDDEIKLEGSCRLENDFDIDSIPFGVVQ